MVVEMEEAAAREVDCKVTAGYKEADKVEEGSQVLVCLMRDGIEVVQSTLELEPEL